MAGPAVLVQRNHNTAALALLTSPQSAQHSQHGTEELDKLVDMPVIMRQRFGGGVPHVRIKECPEPSTTEDDIVEGPVIRNRLREYESRRKTLCNMGNYRTTSLRVPVDPEEESRTRAFRFKCIQ